MDVLVPVVLVVLALVSVTEQAIFGLSLPFPGIPCLSGGIKWNNLKVKYDPPMIGRFSIPLSTGTIGNEYQFLQAHEEFPLVSLYAYKDDPRVQTMYDKQGNICGMRVAYIMDEINKRTPKDVLKTGGPATRKEAVGTGVYIIHPTLDGTAWVEMPRNEKDIKKTKFTKQACFIGMGRHYFYNMTPEMKCEDHHPVFLLYHGGELIGLGLIPFGTFDAKYGRPWFEDPPKWVINKIVPTAPTCLAEWVDKYGTISIHIYFRAFNALNCVL